MRRFINSHSDVDSMRPINPDLKRYVEELDCKDTYLRGMNDEGDGTILGPDVDDEVFANLLSHGVVIPYADAVSYEKKGILVVGEGGIGKSPLVGKMQKLFPQESQVLAFDSPSIYQPDNTQRAVVYLDDIRSNEFPFFAPFLYPGDIEEYPIEYLIHLRKDNRRILREGDIEEAVNYSVFEGSGYPRTREAETKMREILNGVKCYDFFKPMGYASSQDLRNYAREVKELVE